MEFEEMKVIWDSQSKQPMYAIDRGALHLLVKARGKSVQRFVNMAEGTMIAMFLTIGILVGEEPLVKDRDWHQLISAIVYLVVACYLTVGLVRRRRHEQTFDASLRGDVEKALSQVEHHIRRWKSLVWWCIFPFFLTTCISCFFLYNSKPWWLWAAMAIALIVTYVGSRIELSRKLTPKKRELQSLRDLLSNEADTAE